MVWYYAINNEQKGPVEAGELERLVQEGVVNAGTLVWREGMSDWQRYGEMLGPTAAVGPGAATATASAASLGAGSVVCAECGQAFAPDQVIRLGTRNFCAGCKPVAIQKLREGVAIDSDAERIRKEHIKHEASVKSVGVLYFLGAGLLILLGFLDLTAVGNRSGQTAMTGVLAVFFLALAGVQLWAGIGLRRLRPWARIVSGILSGFGLLGFPLGTLINAYILYLLFSKKGTMVFSEGYQRVIEETPQIKYRTSIVVWILLGVLIALLGIAMIGILAVGRRGR